MTADDLRAAISIHHFVGYSEAGATPRTGWCACDTWPAEASDEPGDYRDWLDHAEAVVRSAIEAAARDATELRPPAPRWPSRDELAKALGGHSDWDYTGSPSKITCECRWSTLPLGGPVENDIRVWREHVADAILAALREGGER